MPLPGLYIIIQPAYGMLMTGFSLISQVMGSKGHFRTHKDARSGSALLLTIMMVSILLVMVLTLVVMVRMELRRVTLTQDNLIARQNAKLGLQLAVSQLQKYAGADQRVTVPASTVYPEKNFDELYDGDAEAGIGEMFDLYRARAQTSSLRSYLDNVGTYVTPAEREDWELDLQDWWQDRQPHWTGIFNSSLRVDRATDPASPTDLPDQDFESGATTLFGEFDRTQLPVWLVSGNERFSIEPRDSGYPAGYVQPTIALPDPEDDDTVVWLVGEGSAAGPQDSVDGLDGKVKVPSQEIRDDEGVVTGHYAYWVGDESIKANFAVQRENPETYAETSVDYRNYLQVPQRVGWEQMTGFKKLFEDEVLVDIDNDPFNPDFAKLISHNEIGLLDDNFQDDPATPENDGIVAANFHHITSYSQSLLTDTALGGLKQDLTQYLENGAGLDGDDPIADPSRYDPLDSRFATHGGTNTGFPFSSDAALDGIPKWGEVLSWYENVATGANGSIQPDVENGTHPVLTYLHMSSGLSYHGPSEMVRLHWAPLITLWNPYDVNLSSGTYDIIVEIPVVFHKFLLVDPDATLAELQQADPESDWQMWNMSSTNMAGELVGPNGKRLLEAYMDGNELKARHPSVEAGQKMIFKALLDDVGKGELDMPAGDTDRDDRFFVRVDPPPTNYPADYNLGAVETLNLPSTYDLNRGPWTLDSNPANGTTDPFGRLFYGLDVPAGDPVGMYIERKDLRQGSAETRGGLHLKEASVIVNPHHDTDTTANRQLPLRRKIRLRVSTSFEAGECKVFTLPVTPDIPEMQEWFLNKTYNLVEGIDPDMPGWIWMDMLKVSNGPAHSNGLRFRKEMNINTQDSQPSPAVTINLNGEQMFRSLEFGNVSVNRLNAVLQGRAYRTFSWDHRTKDLDGDGVINGYEVQPKMVGFWRRLFDYNEFENRVNTQFGTQNNQSNWSFGENYITPFYGEGTLGSSDMDSIHHFTPAFSRFNIGSSDFSGNPYVEALRDPGSENAIHPDEASYQASGSNPQQRKSGLHGFNHLRGRDNDGMGGASEVKWDGSQVDQDSGSHGYTMVTATYDPFGDPMEGLTHLSIRNARRAQSEILSLGQLQQINLSPYFSQPAFPIGNADAAPYTDREGIAGIHSRIVGTATNHTSGQLPDYVGGNVRPNHARPTPGDNPFPSDQFPPNTTFEDGAVVLHNSNNDPAQELRMGGNTVLDLSYLLNENIWDSYFLSSLTTLPSTLLDRLPNSRIRFSEEAPLNATLLDEERNAAFLRNHGALNVNSTSVEAWKALLTAFRDLSLGDNPEDTVPVSRTLDPIAQSVGFHFDTDSLGGREAADYGNSSSNKNYEKVLSGFRYLDDEMVEALAERIVDEVRLRGPFYSLSDFVNRRLVPPDGSNQSGSAWWDARTEGKNNRRFIDPSYDPFQGLQGLNGALQRAINLSGINGGVNHPSLGDNGLGAGDRYDMVYSIRIRDQGDEIFSNSNDGYTSQGIGGSVNEDKGIQGWDNGFRHSLDPAIRSHVDTEHYAGVPVGEAGQLLQGAPGFVTQGDILAMIGPALTARGDTFLVRAYGSAGPADAPSSKSWLEAVVQRTPAPVNPDATDPLRPTSIFGRRFKIVSMRWLMPDEI